jgi:DNA polymerase-3 subunit alpha
VAIDFGDTPESDRPGAPRLNRFSDVVLIAASEDGYWNLVRLVSSTFMDTPPGDRTHLAFGALEGASDGLILLTGGPGGPIDRAIAAGQSELAGARLDRLMPLFRDRLYVELQRHRTPVEEAVEPHLLDLAYARGLPLVATNEVFFTSRGDYEAHDALICIAEGAVIADDNRRRLTPEHYFKSRAEMTALFADLPEATRNTVEIAMRAAFWPRVRKPILPRFAGGDADATAAELAEAELLRQSAKDGLDRRLAAHGMAPGRSREDYDARLEFELGVIIRMKYPGYFLIVADFIQWAKGQGIPVGPGRGSGAGSLVA